MENAKNWFHLARENLGSDGAEMIHFPLLRIFFHDTLPFCFKKLNNFQSGRKSEKLIIFGAKNVAHVVKGFKNENSVNNFQGAWGDFVVFWREKWFLRQNSEIPPKIGKLVKMVPKDQGNHYVYRGWRHGGENVIYGSQSEEFWWFPDFGSQNGFISIVWSKFREKEFPGALDDGKGSDRALATGKGMPFWGAFSVINIKFPDNGENSSGR